MINLHEQYNSFRVYHLVTELKRNMTQYTKKYLHSLKKAGFSVHNLYLYKV